MFHCLHLCLESIMNICIPLVFGTNPFLPNTQATLEFLIEYWFNLFRNNKLLTEDMF